MSINVEVSQDLAPSLARLQTASGVQFQKNFSRFSFTNFSAKVDFKSDALLMAKGTVVQERIVSLNPALVMMTLGRKIFSILSRLKPPNNHSV